MIVEAIKGYRAADLPKDAVAGLVIAALSIPIAMGYAEVVGLPAIYGLWTSIVAPLAFGLLTGTRRVVFGMDSAAAAMTASMLAAAGIAAQGQDAIVSAMPLLTLLTALFLLLRPGNAPSVGGTPVGTATLTVSCENLLGDERADDGLRAAVPDDGLLVPPTEVTVLEGDTAFTLLERVCAERGLALDVQRGLSGVYVQGIGGVREFDCGALSGWLFRINGEIRSTDSGSVVLQDGDVLEFLYTCELGADIR